MLESIINVLAYGSLLFAAGAAYLQLNKLWSRKHLPEVAESISIPGILVESIPLFFFGLYFLSKGEMLGIIDSIIWLTSAILVTMIGAGFWVKGQRKQGLWRLALKSIARERKEVTALARTLINPASTEQLVRVLTSLAAVDGVVDPREKALVSSFADEWNIDIDWNAVSVSDSSNSLILDTREALLDYLDTTPPKTQVTQLLDVLKLLVDADENCSPEEELAFNEMTGHINRYLSDDALTAGFTVVIAPQHEEQDEAIRLMLEEVEPHTYAGGRGYTVGQYFSRNYAEIICQEYRALGFFTVVMDESNTPAPA